MGNNVLKVVSIFSLIPYILAYNFKNNACKSFSDYYTIYFNKNCYYIPDANKNVSDIVKRHIGQFEAYEVTTEDGYILDLFRIPRENPKGVILLQHPVTGDSKLWVVHNNESIAFIFWRAGYDVWLGNNRGTFYSKKHVNLTTKDPKFWDYSFHEIGIYDHSANLKFIKQKTNNSKIIYLGHSMAGTSSLIYASMKPKEASNYLKIIINMAPTSYLKYSPSPLRDMCPFSILIRKLSPRIGWHSILRHNNWYMKLVRLFFAYLPFQKLVAYGMSFIGGWTPNQFDPEYVNIIVSQYGSEVSWKTFDHYSQLYSSGGKFQMFDYGKKKNLKLYGTEQPTSYPIEKIETPVYIFYARNDTVSSEKDNEFLYSKLPEKAKIYGKGVVDDFNHFDFFTGKDMAEKIYEKILRLLDNL